jgi:hypothetical protein
MPTERQAKFIPSDIPVPSGLAPPERGTKDDAQASGQTNPDGAACQSKENSADRSSKYQTHPRRESGARLTVLIVSHG